MAPVAPTAAALFVGVPLLLWLTPARCAVLRAMLVRLPVTRAASPVTGALTAIAIGAA
jgi:hypothetical protein